MKTLIVLAVMVVAVIAVFAQPLSKWAVTSATPAQDAPTYQSESPLPQGWPAPGPFDGVTEKRYPASRVAVTTGSIQNFSFWTLFRHIRRNGIPMTSPVEMAMKEDAGGGMKMHQMGFLYQSPTVGKAGADGGDVMVRDLPPLVVLSYTWQGPRDAAALSKARVAIKSELACRELHSSEYRLLGYNSPAVPAKKQTHELQAVIK